MPFRKQGVPNRAVPLLLPCLIVVVLLGVAVWLLAAFATLPSGWERATPNVKLLLFGFAGIAVVSLFIGVVIVTILEDVIHRAQQLNEDVVLTVVRRLEAQGILSRAEAAAAVRRDEKAEVQREQVAAAMVVRDEATVVRDEAAGSVDQQRHDEHMDAERRAETQQNQLAGEAAERDESAAVQREHIAQTAAERLEVTDAADEHRHEEHMEAERKRQ